MKRTSFEIHSVVQRIPFLMNTIERISVVFGIKPINFDLEVLPDRFSFDVQKEIERIPLTLETDVKRIVIMADNTTPRITATVSEQKTTPRVSFGINKTISRISTSIRQTVFRLSADIDASIGRVVGEISHWIDVAGVLFRHRESAISKMFVDFYNNVLMPSVREAAVTKMMVSFWATIFMTSVKEKASTNMAVQYWQNTLFPSIKETSVGKMLTSIYQNVLMKSDKETTVSNMWATIYNDVLLKSVDVAQTFCAFVGTMVFSFRHRETVQTFCSAAYDLATLLESTDVQRHSMALGTAYDTVFQSVDIALNEARIRYTRPVLLEDYTFAIGDPDIKLSDWCYTELDYS